MKKLQNKILLIFFIIGTIIIIGMGAFFAGIVGETQDFIGTSEYVTSQDLINITDTQMNQAKILILGTILVFSCIVIVVGIFISEAIVKPLNKMIINAQKLANGESVELIELNPKKKRKKKRRIRRCYSTWQRFRMNVPNVSRSVRMRPSASFRNYTKRNL